MSSEQREPAGRGGDAIEVSIVVPVFNEEEVLPALYDRVSGVMARSGASWELLLVDDGSRDRSLETMRELRARDPRVSVLELSRNFGHQVAISAGLDHARGAAVVVMDADLQDPPEVVLDMIARWREGCDVVYGRRRARHGERPFKRATAAAFYRLIRALTSVDIPADTGDFRLMSRRAVEALRRLRERNRFVRGLSAWVGFRQVSVEYDRAPRLAGETKYPLRKMVRFASDAIVSFSITPLRVATAFGFAVSFASFAYAAYAVYLKIVTGESLPGWASLMVAVVFLGGVQLLCLGILGEYVGRIFEEVKARPLYLVADLQQGDRAAVPEERDVRVDATTAA
jgi:dolichol-phosphate mannosyltransferase